MNETFNLRRFRLFFTKTILERPTQIIGIFILSFSIVFLVYFLTKSIANFELAQLFSFAIGFVGGGCLLASVVFGYFFDNAITASYLTLPASAFEKWLCGVIIVGVFYFFGFLVFFRAIDSLFVFIYHSGLNPQDPRYRNQYDAVYVFQYAGNEEFFIFFLNAVGAMLVGSLYFNKIPFIKTALVICGAYFFTFLLNYLINSILFRDLDSSYPFHNVRIKNGAELGVVELPSKMIYLFDILAFYVLPSILFGLSYIRLKEKEV
jgi:hypothetical protein